jgi:hypothetical protein
MMACSICIVTHCSVSVRLYLQGHARDVVEVKRFQNNEGTERHNIAERREN